MPHLYRRARTWWCAYRDPDGVRIRESCGTTDRAVAARIAAARENRAALIREGIIDPGDLIRAEARRRPIPELVRDYLAHLRAAGAGAYTIDDRETLLERFAAWSGPARRPHTAADLGRRSIRHHVEAWLASVAETGVQGRRVRDHLRAVQGLVRWCYDEELVEADHLASGVRMPARLLDDERHPRRAMTPAEVAALLRSLAARSEDPSVPARQRAGAAERILAYRFRVWTGLRDREASRIVRGDLEQLDGGLVVRVRAEVAKTGRACLVPIPEPLATDLLDAVGLRMPDAPLFPGDRIDHRARAHRMRRDFTRAGLPIRTDAGVLCAGSWRKTYSTWLEAAGVDEGTRGKLRRDVGRGSTRLVRWTYSDQRQAMPRLRAALAAAVAWHDRQLEAPPAAAGGTA